MTAIADERETVQNKLSICFQIHPEKSEYAIFSEIIENIEKDLKPKT